jgi:hypothetical protein
VREGLYDRPETTAYRDLIQEGSESLSLASRNCFALFVKIAVAVFAHPIRIRDLSILFDDARIFRVKLRIIA